jgi:hypothetical protein
MLRAAPHALSSRTAEGTVMDLANSPGGVSRTRVSSVRSFAALCQLRMIDVRE